MLPSRNLLATGNTTECMCSAVTRRTSLALAAAFQALRSLDCSPTLQGAVARLLPLQRLAESLSTVPLHCVGQGAPASPGARLLIGAPEGVRHGRQAGITTADADALEAGGLLRCSQAGVVAGEEGVPEEIGLGDILAREDGGGVAATWEGAAKAPCDWPGVYLQHGPAGCTE